MTGGVHVASCGGLWEESSRTFLGPEERVPERIKVYCLFAIVYVRKHVRLTGTISPWLTHLPLSMIRLPQSGNRQLFKFTVFKHLSL